MVRLSDSRLVVSSIPSFHDSIHFEPGQSIPAQCLKPVVPAGSSSIADAVLWGSRAVRSLLRFMQMSVQLSVNAEFTVSRFRDRGRLSNVNLVRKEIFGTHGSLPVCGAIQTRNKGTSQPGPSRYLYNHLSIVQRQ